MTRASWLVTPLVALLAGCHVDPGVLLSAAESPPPETGNLRLVARIAHLSDTHQLDEESPARFAGAHVVTPSAWRPYEAYSTQLLDGIIRSINRVHASGRPIDFVLHTGDGCDNSQSNELAWLLANFDGVPIDPRSGPDDRPPAARPPSLLDPHAPFVPQGLYRQGVHGLLPTIPWYVVVGNHDVYALGVFPIFAGGEGRRVAPLPLPWRPGWVLPVRLDPLDDLAYGNVTPADPGPPRLFECPRYVEPSAARAYFDRGAFRAALGATQTGSPGHGGSAAPDAPPWYSVAPLPGLRLIGLDTTDRRPPPPGAICSEGALSSKQLEYLGQELEAAAERGEIVIVASHHPSERIVPVTGSEVSPAELRERLERCPAVVLHLAGHTHRNRVTQRGGYLEIETCSTLDPPQEWRLIEIWRDDEDGRIIVTYRMFSHLDDALPPLGDDPLRELRAAAHALAADDKDAAARQKLFDPTGADPRGSAADRAGTVAWPEGR